MAVKQWLKTGLVKSSERLGQLGQLGKNAAQALQETATRACSVCGQPVLRTSALQCPECGQMHCRSCRASVLVLGQAAGGKQVQVCRNCEPDVRHRHTAANVAERMERLESFFEGRLEPFVYSPESKLQKSLRLSGHVMYGLKQVGGLIPLGQAAHAIKAGYYLVRYGPLLLAGNEIMEAFQLLVNLVRRVDTPVKSKVLSSQFFGGMYYMMGEHWGQRGRVPELERMEHLAVAGSVPAPAPELLLRLRRLVGLIYAAKEPTATDAQRLLRQALPGAELVLAELASMPTKPAFALACSRRDMAAYLVLPGTKSPADCVADLYVQREAVASGSGHRGMVRHARWLFEEVGPVLRHLHTKGYSVTVVGHSLGAGVGGFLTVLLRPSIESIFCYGLGTPACCGEDLVPALLDCMVTVINRDDVVPRMTVQSVQELAEAVLCPGQLAKTEAWMAEDWRAVKDVERMVALRRRGAPGAQEASDSTEPPSRQEEEEEEAPDTEEAKLQVLLDAGIGQEAARRALRAEEGDLSRALLLATEDETEQPLGGSRREEEEEEETDEVVPSSGDPQPAPSSSIGESATARAASSGEVAPPPSASQSAAGGNAALGEAKAVPGGDRKTQPRFLVPGQIIHLYRHNGLGRAAVADCLHDAFSRIMLCQDLLNDHKLGAYAEALQQASILEPQAPRWESFEDRPVCSCCGADFNWAIVLHSEPQQMLARQHCFACGGVVCEGCSQRRLAHPKLGFHGPVRTCDRCFFSQYSSPVE